MNSAANNTANNAANHVAHNVSRLSLGCAQLGMAYGAANTRGQLDEREAFALLDAAAAHGIRCLDTAPAYGESEERIGAWRTARGATADVRIATKLARLPPEPGNLDAYVLAAVRASLSKLAVERVDFLLLHDAGDLRRFGAGIIDALLLAKQRGLVAEIGVSAYATADVELMLAHPHAGAVQIPLNLLDHRFLQPATPGSRSLVAELAHRNVTVFSRSAYLQGAFSVSPSSLPAHLAHLRPWLARLSEIAARFGVTPADVAVAWCARQPGVSSVVVGAETIEQVAANAAALDRAVPAGLHEALAAWVTAEPVPVDVIDPSRWPSMTSTHAKPTLVAGPTRATRSWFLRGERIALKKLDRDEVSDAYVRWMNDAEVTKYLVSGNFPTTLDDVRTFVDGANSGGKVTFAIYRLDDERHIGNVKLDHLDWISRRCDLGIMIGDRASWGKGFGTEATALATRYAFEKLGLERVTLGVVVDNGAAAHVYEKLGYVVDGKRERDQYKDGNWLDTVMMSATRRRFLSRTDRVVAVIQARMSSSRLPGKILKPLAGKPALLQLIDRARAVSRIDEVVLATSDDASDDVVADAARGWGVRTVRGSLLDVLGRFQAAAEAARADVVIRLTGDCPMHDPAVIAQAIDTHLSSGVVDYVSNAEERSFPDGHDVEVFSMAALSEAARAAQSVFEREHVTPWLRRHKVKRSIVQHEDLSQLCWTLDTPDDYAFMCAAFEACGPSLTTSSVYRWLIEQPERLWLMARRTPDAAATAELVRRMRSMLAGPPVTQT